MGVMSSVEPSSAPSVPAVSLSTMVAPLSSAIEGFTDAGLVN